MIVKICENHNHWQIRAVITAIAQRIRKNDSQEFIYYNILSNNSF